MKRLLLASAALFAATFAHAQSIIPGTPAAVTSVSTSGLLSGGTCTTTCALSISNIGAGDLVGNSTSGSAAPADTTLTALIDQAIGSTRGAILERGASGWVLLPPSSTAGQALSSNGIGAEPTYQTIAGGTGCTITGGAANNVVTTNAGNTCTPTLTTITSAGAIVDPAAGGLSSGVGPALSITGAPITGGTGSTTVALVYINQGAGPTTFSTSGTEFAINGPSGFAGNFFDIHLNGGASLFSVSSTGGVTSSGSANLGAGSTSDFVSIGGISNAFLSSPSANGLQIGKVDAAVAVAQYISFQSATTAGNAGANALFKLSKGATSGIGGDLTFQCAPTGTIGYVTCLTLSHLGVPVAPGYTVSTLPAAPPTGAYAYVTDAVACTFLASLTGGGSTFCPVNYTGSAWVGG